MAPSCSNLWERSGIRKEFMEAEQDSWQGGLNVRLSGCFIYLNFFYSSQVSLSSTLFYIIAECSSKENVPPSQCSFLALNWWTFEQSWISYKCPPSLPPHPSNSSFSSQKVIFLGELFALWCRWLMQLWVFCQGLTESVVVLCRLRL